MEPEEQRRQPIHEPNDDHAERSGRHDGEPHQRDELEGVSELADGVGQVRATEVWLGEQVEATSAEYDLPHDDSKAAY